MPMPCLQVGHTPAGGPSADQVQRGLLFQVGEGATVVGDFTVSGPIHLALERTSQLPFGGGEQEHF